MNTGDVKHITPYQYTQIFLKNADIAVDELNTTYYLNRLWQYNSRRVLNNPSYKLSDFGYDFLINTLKLKRYAIPIGVELTPQIILGMVYNMSTPYYIEGNNIIVFSEQANIDLIFFSDMIDKYGFLEATRRKFENAKKNT